MAYLYNSPTISLAGHSKWESGTVQLNVTSAIGELTVVNIVNLYSVDSLEKQAFKDWIKSLSEGIQLDTDENIKLVFSPKLFEFEKRAIGDIITWYYDDKRFVVRIKELIYDIKENPFSGGKGHTETLSGSGGKSSKRIIKKDRIVYTYTKEKIIIHQCRGHYDGN